MEIAIEVKGVSKVKSDHLKGLREIKNEFPKLKSRYLVCLEERRRITEDGIHIIPYNEFLKNLWENAL